MQKYYMQTFIFQLMNITRDLVIVAFILLLFLFAWYVKLSCLPPQYNILRNKVIVTQNNEFLLWKLDFTQNTIYVYLYTFAWNIFRDWNLTNRKNKSIYISGDEDVQEERDGASCQLDIETAMGIWILSPPQSSNVLKRQVKFFCVIDTVLCDDCR